MPKTDWHYLYLDMMMDYITLKLDSLENNVHSKDILCHFAEATGILTAKMNNSLKELTV
jgi:hypothetical protein